MATIRLMLGCDSVPKDVDRFLKPALLAKEASEQSKRSLQLPRVASIIFCLKPLAWCEYDVDIRFLKEF